MVLSFCVGGNGIGQVDNFGTGNLWHKNFTAFHLFNAIHHKADSLIERQPEARHAFVGDGDLSTRTLIQEQRDDRAAAPTTFPYRTQE